MIMCYVLNMGSSVFEAEAYQICALYHQLKNSGHVGLCFFPNNCVFHGKNVAIPFQY